MIRTVHPSPLQRLQTSLDDLAGQTQTPPESTAAVHAALNQLVAAVTAIVPAASMPATFRDPAAATATNGELSPRMTLGQFFEKWFLPKVLEPKGVTDSTIGGYIDTLNWWSELTNDPPLSAIDESVISQFQTRLRKEGFIRGRFAKNRPLSPFTRHKHLRNLRAMLTRIGPAFTPGKRAAAIVGSVPYFEIRETMPAMRPRSPFTIDQARQIYAAAGGMTWLQPLGGPPLYCRKRNRTGRDSAFTKIRGKQIHLGVYDSPESHAHFRDAVKLWKEAAPTVAHHLPGVPASDWWRALISLLYYTGLRTGTALRLEWTMVKERQDGWCIEVPAGIVKTRKWVDQFLHPAAYGALEKIRQPGVSLLLPWPFHYRTFTKQHYELQRLAGIGKEEQLAPHAWRRTHGTEIARLGLGVGMEAARMALGHSSVNVTGRHYVDLIRELILQLPRLDWPAGASRQARGGELRTKRYYRRRNRNRRLAKALRYREAVGRAESREALQRGRFCSPAGHAGPIFFGREFGYIFNFGCSPATAVAGGKRSWRG